MKYLAMVLMPAKKDLKYFKLKDFLELSCEQIRLIKNKESNVLYQMIRAETLTEAQDAVRVLNPPVHMDNTPEEQKRLLSTPLTHVIFDLADDFDPDKPLKNYVVMVYLLKPEAYPYPELSKELDIADAEVARLLKEIEKGGDTETIDQYRKSLHEALHQQEQLNAILQDSIAMPVKFRGPQYDRIYMPDNVAEPVNELKNSLGGSIELVQARPSVNGFYSRAIAKNHSVTPAASCAENASLAHHKHV